METKRDGRSASIEQNFVWEQRETVDVFSSALLCGG
jgi:hypothetical protein